MASSGFVGVDFQLCPRCGHRADLEFEGMPEGFVGLYCKRCGNAGKFSKKSADTHPPVWNNGPSAVAHGLDAAVTEKVSVTAGLEFGSPWIRFCGAKEELLKAFVDGPLKEKVAMMLERLELSEGF